MAEIFHSNHSTEFSQRWNSRLATRLNRLEQLVIGRNLPDSDPRRQGFQVSNNSFPINVSKTCRSKLGVASKSFWMTLCSIGFFIHFCLITINYVRYNATTLVSISLPEVIIPPALSICTLLLSKINIQSLDPELGEKFIQNKCNQKLTNLDKCTFLYDKYSMADLMNEYSTKFFVIPAGTPIDTETYYHRPNCKCVKLTRELPNNDTVLTAGDMDHMRVYPGRIVYNVYSATRPAVVGLVLHNPRTLSHSREGKMYFFLLEKDPYLHRLDYDEIETEYLKYPFHSHCVSYYQNRYESRGDCIERCYGARYKDKYGKNNAFVVTTKYDEINMTSDFHKLKYDRKIDKSCSMKCHLNCTTKEYFILSSGIFPASWITKKIIATNGEAFFTVSIFSSRPRTSVKLVPSFDFHSFVIYIASIAGSWLGASMIVTGFQLLSFLKKCITFTVN